MKPNILWIITDDQRPDSIAAFNLIRFGEARSPLGNVLSPNVDRLAAMGTTFINTFNQSPGCAPSRTIMHTGRYSHRTGVYGFEYYNPSGMAHWKPMVPEVLRDQAGYQTITVGKQGIRDQHFVGKQGTNAPRLYDLDLGYRNEFAAKGLVEWNPETKWSGGKQGPKTDVFFLPDGTRLYWSADADATPNDSKAFMDRYDIFRNYRPQDASGGGDEEGGAAILGGVNPRPGDQTRDANFAAAVLNHLDHAGRNYTDVLGRQQNGPDPMKPVFIHCGFEFPHTPVLPPAEFREKFKGLRYEIPKFTPEELAIFPPQIAKAFKNEGSDHFSDAEKQQMVADYYAYCAYGDSLVGKLADGFMRYSENQGRPWLILYVCGDNGWKLNEHGMISKFLHYDHDLHNPIIVVSSDKKAFPPGKAVKDFTQFVDMAPTLLAAAGIDISSPDYAYLDGRDLAKTAAGAVRSRDYIISEPTWVVGPRAVIRTKDYKFAMKVRPQKGFAVTPASAGKDIDWAIKADLKDIEPTLFDLQVDPAEIHNVAFDPRYRAVLDTLRGKLQSIVLGDGRVEVAWTKEGGSNAEFSNFAPGADDGRIEVPVMKTVPRSAIPKKPNIILLFADDISARELPIYGSSVWSPPSGGNSSDPRYRAKTPVLDQLAKDGCWVTTPWAAVVCSPSRAMMMTGRYAHLHKWWDNKDKGLYRDEKGNLATWPLYESSPLQLGHLAQKAGYGTYWAGKTQMAGDLTRFGYDEGCFTPGGLSDTDNPYTDFTMYYRKVDGARSLINADTGAVIDSYQQHGWYWFPHVRLMNHPGSPQFCWWPDTAESRKKFGLNTYGPDVEQEFIFEFMERQKAAGKPFFIYHTSHLGHDAFDWFHPDSKSKWPGTPVVEWTGDRYVRTEPNVTGDNGVYDTHGTVTEPGIHNQINYLDYQVWRYRQMLYRMGIADNTILIFCADNGTSGYGKQNPDRQKGTHVPLIIHAPGMIRHGRQDVLVNMSDFLPTLADLTGAKLPTDYEHNGESLVPFLFGEKPAHREWLYAYSGAKQFIRGTHVMRDGSGKWWDVSAHPPDLISFPQVKDWNSVSEAHRAERQKLETTLRRFNNHDIEPDKPGLVVPAGAKPRGGDEG